MDPLIMLLITVAAAAMVSVAQYLFKLHMPRIGLDVRSMLALARNPYVISGLLIYVASLAVYLYALSMGQLSYVYPAFASSFIFVMFISAHFLKERIGPGRMLGAALILAGILVVASTYV